MASGTITLTRTGSGYLTGQIVWSSVSNGTAANTSTATAALQIQRSALNTTTGTFKGTFTVGGTSETISWYGSLPSMEWVTIKTITATVSHNADGNGSCYLYAIVNGPSETTMEGTYVSGSSTVTLDWIPRYASIISVADFTDEGNPVITYSNPAGEAIESLQACISLTGAYADVPYKDIPKTGTSYTFPLTEDERNLLRAAAPNSNTLTVYVYLQSTIGGSSSLPYQTATMTIVNAEPTVSGTVVDTNGVTKALTGDPAVLVALHSTASVTINAEAKKYAAIKSQSVENGNAVLTGNGTLSPVTNHPIKFTATDSRGNTAVQYAGNTIIPYIDPTCEIGNNIPEAGGAFALVVTGLVYNGSFGVKSNQLTVQYRYKTAGGNWPSTWTTFTSVSKSGNSYTATANLTGLDYQTVYTFQARVLDSVHTGGVNSAEKAVISKPVFDWGEYDFKFNVPAFDSKGGLIVGGYGLGESSGRDISGIDFNTVTKNGWYSFAGDVINSPQGSMGYSYMFVIARNESYITQFIFQSNHDGAVGVVLKRTRYSGVWGEWEYINPLMLEGIVYRTTERYNGKPVYTMLMNCGKGPNNTTLDIPIPDTNIDEVFYCSVTTTYPTVMPMGGTSLSADFSYAGAIGRAVRVVSTTNLSGYTCYAVVKYTKTTD